MRSRDLAISTADAKKGRREVWCEGLRECVYVVGRGLDARGCSGGVGGDGAAEEAAHGGGDTVVGPHEERDGREFG